MPGGGASNVRKSGLTGRAGFVHAIGSFAGESYDLDPNNLITWYEGGMDRLDLAGPSVATLRGAHGFTATVSGTMPLTPITYYWTVTDQAPTNHTHSNLSDPLSACRWTTTGTKTVHVLASNAVNSVQANMSVEVAALGLQMLGRQRIGSTNAVNTLLTGTSAGSTYQVRYCTNLAQGFWSNALPNGVSIPGLNGSTPWTDLGGPGRDLNTATPMFYRAVLPTP